jgi:hypothetical protein
MKTETKSTGSGQDSVAGFCEHGNEASGFIDAVLRCLMLVL